MERFNSFFNESIELIPKKDKFVLATSYEDQNAHGMEHEFEKMQLILDAACPEKFVAISTGNYIYSDVGDYYDNYNNQIILVKREVWEKYKKVVVEHEKRIYKKYKVEFPEWKELKHE